MKQQQEERVKRIITQNRKAQHEYFIVETYEAGIQLTGTEVKALRAGKCNMQDSFAEFLTASPTQLTLLGLHISPYEQGNIFNHKPTRERRLLLHTSQLVKLFARVREKGYTIVPTAIYFSGSYVKVELGLAKGKKQYDKRADIKERDIKKSLRRAFDDD